MRIHPTLVIVLLAAGAWSVPGGNGEAAPRLSSDSTWTGTHVVEARWLHARQRPEATGFKLSRAPLRIDSLSLEDGRSYVLRIGRADRAGSLRIGPDGGPVEARVDTPDLAPLRAMVSHAREAGLRDVQRMFLRHRFSAFREPVTDEARLWDIAPVRPPRLEPGVTTRDTLRLHGGEPGLTQSIEGPRLTTITRDTVVDGRRLWIGRDSAAVTYREQHTQWQRSLDTLVVVERTAEGTLRGRFLYDPDLGLFRARWDTLTATGEAVMRRPDGVVHRSPASYERRVDWTLRSPAAQRAWEEEQRREARRTAMSIVRLPATPLEQRLAEGDTAAADSLLRAWPAADARERFRIRNALVFAPMYYVRLDSLELAEGAWTARMKAMTDRVWGGPPLDSAEMAEYLRLLRDPGLGFEHGLDMDPAYENLAGGLVMNPPTLDAPAARTSCTPAACRLLAAERDAEEPRLRKTALVAAFVLEPEAWADSLLARPDTASHLLHPAVLLARGVGATWPAARKRPAPPPGADWRAWRLWTGVDDHAGGAPAQHPPLLRIGSTHHYAIRMTERLTGRDIGAELAATADTATSDSARAVLRALGLEFGSITPDLDEVVAAFRSGDQLERDVGQRALQHLMAERQPTPPDVAREVVGQLLAMAIDDEEPWSAHLLPAGAAPGVGVRAAGRDPDGPARVAPRPAWAPDATVPLYVAREGLPEPVRRYWESRDDVEVIAHQAWRAQPSRAAGVLLSVDREPVMLGPLVWITLQRQVRHGRAEDEAPGGWADWHQYLLLRTDEGWSVVQVDVIVT